MTRPKSTRRLTTTGKPEVLEVEHQSCTARTGTNHKLTNHGAAVRCAGCGATWADLDRELNQRDVA